MMFKNWKKLRIIYTGGRNVWDLWLIFMGLKQIFSKSPNLIIFSVFSVFVFWLSLVIFTLAAFNCFHLILKNLNYWKVSFVFFVPWAFCHPAFLAHVPSICPWRLNHIWERPPRDHRCTRRPHGVPQSRRDPETWTPVVPPAVFD